MAEDKGKKEKDDVVEEKEEETVKVSKSMLEQIIENDKKRSEEIEELKEKNKMLEEISDQGRKQRYQAEHNDGELVKIIRIPFYKTEEGRRRVVGWESGADEVGYTREGKPFFKQTVILHLIDDNDEIEKLEVDQSIFYKNLASEKAEVLKEQEEKTKNGSTVVFTAKLENGKEVEIDSKFINVG